MITYKRGFTLIEIIIAMAISAILLLTISGVLHNALNSYQHLRAHNQRLAKFQLALLILQRDFRQIVKRPIRNINGKLNAPVMGSGSQIEFTRTGIIRPLADHKHTQLQRVRYVCQNNQLLRQSWTLLDRHNPSPDIQQVLLRKVSTCNFEPFYKTTGSQASARFLKQVELPQHINISIATNTEAITLLIPVSMEMK